MVDIFSKRKRSEIMSKIRGKNNKVEILFAKGLRKAKIKFRRYPKILKRGNPDFLIGNAAVFIDGCFWHKCPMHYRAPKSRKSYWLPKIEQNVERDKEVNRKLKKMDYKVIRIWEHDIRKDTDKSVKKVRNVIGK